MTFHHAGLVRFGVAAVALAALLGWGSTSGATAASATRSGTSESAKGMLVDQRIARDARLRLSDFPTGWSGQDTASTPTAAAPCPRLHRAQGFISAGMASRTFTFLATDSRTAQNETYIYADAALAKHWFGEFSSRSTRVCLAHVLRDELNSELSVDGVKVGAITEQNLAVTPVGDQDAGFRVTVGVVTSGVSLKVDADVVFVRTGRGLEIFSLAALGSPFDPGLEQSLVRTVTARLTADLRTAS